MPSIEEVVAKLRRHRETLEFRRTQLQDELFSVERKITGLENLIENPELVDAVGMALGIGRAEPAIVAAPHPFRSIEGPPVLAPPEEPTTPKRRRTKQHLGTGVAPIAVRILRAAFAGERVPQNLQEALEMTYGDKLNDVRVNRLEGRGRAIRQISAVEDIRYPRGFVRTCLGRAGRSLRHVYRAQQAGADVEVSPMLRNLAHQIRLNERAGEVFGALRSWGVLENENG